MKLYKNNTGMKKEYQGSLHKVLKWFHAQIKQTLIFEALESFLTKKQLLQGRLEATVHASLNPGQQGLRRSLF